MLLNQKPQRKNFNVFQLYHGLDHFRHDQLDAFESPDGVLDLVSHDKLASFTREFYQLDEVKALYKMRKKFDLIVVHQMLSEVKKKKRLKYCLCVRVCGWGGGVS